MRRTATAFMLFLSVLGTLVFVPGSANAAPIPSSYMPTQGEVVADVHGDFFELTIAFSLNQAQLESLQATAEFLELDFVVTNVTIAGNSQNYSIYGNLPYAQQDVGFHDATFTPSFTMIQTSHLEANKHYWATVKFHSGISGVPTVSAQFVPSRWHEGLPNLKEWGACEVGKVRWSGAWCIFPIEGARVLLTEQTFGAFVPINGSRYTLDPGMRDLNFSNFA